MPLGPNRNVMQKDSGKTWRVVDDAGRTLFDTPTDERNGYMYSRVGMSGGMLYLSTLNFEQRTWSVSLITDSGKKERTLSMPPRKNVLLQPAMGYVFAYGPDFTALEGWFPWSPTAAAIKDGVQVKGDLPKEMSRSLDLVSEPAWGTIYLITGGDFREQNSPMTLLEFDKDLKQTFSHAVSLKNQRLEFVATDKDTIYMAVTAPGGTWHFAYYDVKARKLADAPLPAPKGPWLNGMALGEGKIVVWGEQGFLLSNPRVPITRAAQMKTTELPDPKWMTLAPSPGAVAEDGRFALAAYKRSKLPKKALIYSRDGELLEQIEMREGFIEHLKFVSGGKELLVFAREYTARVQLTPPPATAPSTQPTTKPHRE